MLNSNFVITLLTILATLVCLFQNEIKESFSTTDPMVYGTLPKDGLMPDGKFGPWSNNSQFMLVPTELTPNPINRTLGYDFSAITKLQPRTKNTRENFNADMTRGVEVEAPRNMQTRVPPRLMHTGPKMNHTYPIDMARYAVDTDNPITDYGCGSGTILSSTGQVLMKPSRENYEDSQSKLPNSMVNIYGQKSGHMSQSVVLDRVMYSGLKSRYWTGGDYVRGTVDTIVPDNMATSDGKENPNAHPKWFQVPVKPNRDNVPSYIVQHNKRGKESDEKLKSIGLAPDKWDAGMSHGRDHGITATFGTDVHVNSNGL